MNQFPVALQLYSVREDMEKDFTTTLKAVKAMGYEGVEFAGLYNHKPEDVKALCLEIGLIPLSAHVPFTELIADPYAVMEQYAQIGCQYVVIPYLLPEYRPGNEKFSEVIEGAGLLGKVAGEFRMKLLYHNHDFEFVKIDGEYALDILYKKVPSDKLETELDTCWVNVGGENPAAYIRKYQGRAPVVHIKDFSGRKGENMYSLIGISDAKTKKAENEEFEFRPVGYGVQNVPEILKACEFAGTKWIVVEQDEPGRNRMPMECAKLSIDYLKSL